MQKRRERSTPWTANAGAFGSELQPSTPSNSFDRCGCASSLRADDDDGPSAPSSLMGVLAPLPVTCWPAGGRRCRVGGSTHGWRGVAVSDGPAPVVALLAAAGRVVW